MLKYETIALVNDGIVSMPEFVEITGVFGGEEWRWQGSTGFRLQMIPAKALSLSSSLDPCGEHFRIRPEAPSYHRAG